MKGRTGKDKRFVVYMHENIINGKKYIGITSKKPEDRWGKDGVRYKNNSNIYFWNAIQKYGWDNFKHEILLEDLSLSDALKKEFEISKTHNTTDSKFGYNGTVGRGGNFEISEESRLKYSNAVKGEKNPMYGKKHSKETIIKLKEINTKNAMYGKDNPVSRAVKGVNIETNEEILFESANQAATHFNLFNNGHIIECCRGKRKSCKGYRWEYI
jgi:group I intron endonuclease